jgi:methionine-S-sulfoxide reductase
MESTELTESIVVGGGCFWCLEPIFEQLDGVKKITVGYAGGTKKNPSYEQVCTGATGHAEVVRIVFDPAKISLESILMVFFKTHDPTTLNRQGADAGTQYRSIILYESDRQKSTAEDVIQSLSKQQIFSKPIVTAVSALDEFFPAEEYHQQYYKKNPWAGYCQAVIRPKLEKFEHSFSDIKKH